MNFSESSLKKLKAMIRSLREKKLSVSFAESCTGGRLSAFLTSQPGVSDIFMGSVVSYSNEVKIDLLGVRRDALKNEGAVSEGVARQMAYGVRNQLKSNWSVAITGIAGPSGGTPTKPVGTVCFAVCGPGFEQSWSRLYSGDRSEIQQQSVDTAIELLTEALRQ